MIFMLKVMYITVKLRMYVLNNLCIKTQNFRGGISSLTLSRKLKFRYVLKPFMFVIYFKFQGNRFHINGFRVKKRCPKVTKRTIVIDALDSF